MMRACIVGAVVAAAMLAGPAEARSRLGFELSVPELGLGDDAAFAGGGARRGGDDVLPIVAFVLGFIPGFGIGHIIAGDNDGFTFWLLVDVLIIAVYIAVEILLSAASIFGTTRRLIEAVAGLLWLAIHVVQGLDAMEAAGGRNPLKSRAALTVEPVVATLAPAQRPLPTVEVVRLRF